jgi:hypothetical protein
MSERYFLYQLPIYDSETPSPWCEIFDLVSQPGCHKTELERARQEYQCFILAEIIRREWNSKFRVHNFRGPFRKWLDANGELWHQTFILVEKVFSVYPYLEHPAVWFTGVLFELEVSTFLIEGGTTKKASLEKFRCENKQLQDLGNPFQEECTRMLLESALKLAETSDVFRKNTYMPWVRSRMALASVLNTRDVQLFVQPKGKSIATQSRQGRKK